MEAKYTDAVNPDDYISGLNKHLRIPQIDTKTLEEISKKTNELLLWSSEKVKIVDLGCGPGRLTNRIAQILTGKEVEILGIDEDENFINKAKSKAQWLNNINYQVSELPTWCPSANIFLSYGVWHHLDRNGERQQRKDMIFENLTDTWSLFIGDEFVADYTGKKNRIYNATLLYMNVIWDAYQIAWNKVDELVRIEVMNRVEDLYGSWYGKWVIEENNIKIIADNCLYIKKIVENSWYSEINYHIHNLNNTWNINHLIWFLVRMTKEAYKKWMRCESRWDYKISTDKQIKELNLLKLKNKYFSGNEETYGWMWLLEFTK